MLDRKFFFDSARTQLFDDQLNQQQVDGICAILDEWEARHYADDDRWLAYMLATTHHETARTMAPIEEFGKGRTRRYGRQIRLDGRPYTDTNAIFYGRGFVQLTWYENYERAGAEIGADLVRQPELALDLAIATRIMFRGMREGWFTGRRLAHYFNYTAEDWHNARRIINGSDKAALIAEYGRRYHRCISYLP